MSYPFRDENAVKVNKSYCQKLVEEGVFYTINENKILFDPNFEDINNAFVRLSQVWNKINDADFLIDLDDYYSTEKMKTHLYQKK